MNPEARTPSRLPRPSPRPDTHAGVESAWTAAATASGGQTGLHRDRHRNDIESPGLSPIPMQSAEKLAVMQERNRDDPFRDPGDAAESSDMSARNRSRGYDNEGLDSLLLMEEQKDADCASPVAVALMPAKYEVESQVEMSLQSLSFLPQPEDLMQRSHLQPLREHGECAHADAAKDSSLLESFSLLGASSLLRDPPHGPHGDASNGMRDCSNATERMNGAHNETSAERGCHRVDANELKAKADTQASSSAGERATEQEEEQRRRRYGVGPKLEAGNQVLYSVQLQTDGSPVLLPVAWTELRSVLREEVSGAVRSLLRTLDRPSTPSDYKDASQEDEARLKTDSDNVSLPVRVVPTVEPHANATLAARMHSEELADRPSQQEGPQCNSAEVSSLQKEGGSRQTDEMVADLSYSSVLFEISDEPVAPGVLDALEASEMEGQQRDVPAGEPGQQPGERQGSGSGADIYKRTKEAAVSPMGGVGSAPPGRATGERRRGSPSSPSSPMRELSAAERKYLKTRYGRVDTMDCRATAGGSDVYKQYLYRKYLRGRRVAAMSPAPATPASHHRRPPDEAFSATPTFQRFGHRAERLKLHGMDRGTHSSATSSHWQHHTTPRSSRHDATGIATRSATNAFRSAGDARTQSPGASTPLPGPATASALQQSLRAGGYREKYSISSAYSRSTHWAGKAAAGGVAVPRELNRDFAQTVEVPDEDDMVVSIAAGGSALMPTTRSPVQMDVLGAIAGPVGLQGRANDEELPSTSSGVETSAEAVTVTSIERSGTDSLSRTGRGGLGSVGSDGGGGNGWGGRSW